MDGDALAADHYSLQEMCWLRRGQKLRHGWPGTKQETTGQMVERFAEAMEQATATRRSIDGSYLRGSA